MAAQPLIPCSRNSVTWNRPKWNVIVETEGQNVLIICPIHIIPLSGNGTPVCSALALRTFSLPRIRAIASINVQTVETFQNPNPRVVVCATLLSQPEDLLLLSICIAETFHAANA